MAAPPPIVRPENSIGGGLPHERTALAWERTAIAMMVAGIAFAGHASRGEDLSSSPAGVIFTAVGVAQIAAGGLLLFWAVRNDRMLHDPSLPASVVPQARLTRFIGIGTTAFTALAVALAVSAVLT